MPDAQEASGRSWTRLGIVGRGLGVALHTRKADISPHPRRSGRKAQGNHFPSSITLKSVQLPSDFCPALPQFASSTTPKSVGEVRNKGFLSEVEFPQPQNCGSGVGARFPRSCWRHSSVTACAAPPFLRAATAPRPKSGPLDETGPDWARLDGAGRNWARLDDTGRGQGGSGRSWTRLDETL